MRNFRYLTNPFFYLLLLGLILVNCAPKSTAVSQRQLLEAEYQVPTFSNMEIQDNVYDFLLLFIETQSAVAKSETDESKKLNEKMLNLLEKFKQSSADFTPEDSRKLMEWSTQLLLKAKQSNSN